MPKLSNWMLLWHGVSRMVAEKWSLSSQRKTHKTLKYMVQWKQKVLDKLKDIEDKKEQQAKSREEALKKKKDAKEAFLKCKSQCLCQQPKCLAIGLKQCPVCQV